MKVYSFGKPQDNIIFKIKIELFIKLIPIKLFLAKEWKPLGNIYCIIKNFISLNRIKEIQS